MKKFYVMNLNTQRIFFIIIIFFIFIILSFYSGVKFAESIQEDKKFGFSSYLKPEFQTEQNTSELQNKDMSSLNHLNHTKNTKSIKNITRNSTHPIPTEKKAQNTKETSAYSNKNYTSEGKKNNNYTINKKTITTPRPPQHSLEKNNKQYYTIQLGAFQKETQAKKYMMQLKTKNIATWILKDTLYYRVCVEKSDDIGSLRKKLISIQNIVEDAYIIKNKQ